ncbi:MAG: AI-2E family transporter, partial [Planctomycetota bacterium]
RDKSMDLRDVRAVLLDPVPEDEGEPPSTRAMPGGGRGSILDVRGLRENGRRRTGDAPRIDVHRAEAATGLEVLLERRLITPAVANLARAGYVVEPTQLRTLIAVQAHTLSQDLPEKVTRWGRTFVGKVALSIYEFILILMLTAFLVMDRTQIARFFASLPPPSLEAEYHTLMRYVDRGLAGVIRGQLVVCLVNGALTYVGLLLIGVEGAGLLAVVAGILSLIPIFGTILSSVPIVLVALTDGVDTGLLALGWILLIHLLEANLFNPLIMGTHARMHPVIIIFALLAGEHAFGIWGALLAVPAASILQSCFLFYRHEIEGVPPDPPPPPPAWRQRLEARRRARTAGREAAS